MNKMNPSFAALFVYTLCAMPLVASNSAFADSLYETYNAQQEAPYSASGSGGNYSSPAPSNYNNSQAPATHYARPPATESYQAATPETYDTTQLQRKKVPSYNYNSHPSGPNAADMVADSVLVRPLGIAATLAGTGLFLATLPFSILANDVGNAADKFIREPAVRTFNRCFGCIKPKGRDRFRPRFLP